MKVFAKDLPLEALGCVGLLQTAVIVVNRSKLWHVAVQWPEYIFNVLSFLKFPCFKSQKSRVCYTEGSMTDAVRWTVNNVLYRWKGMDRDM